MIVYHGTTNERAKQIAEEQAIKTTDESITQYPMNSFCQTTFKYVYVTPYQSVALGFALNASLTKNGAHVPHDVTIYEIEIDEKELCTDEDEFIHHAMVSNIILSEPCSFRIKRPLVLGADVIRFVNLSFKNYRSGCNLADDPRMADIISPNWVLCKT